MTMVTKKADPVPRGASLEGMKPEVRKAFEESYRRNEEAMRRLAKL